VYSLLQELYKSRKFHSRNGKSCLGGENDGFALEQAAKTHTTSSLVGLDSEYTLSHPTMAKSLRSKTKRAFRKIKRDDPKSDYHIRDKLRLQRVTEKLKVLTPASDDEAEEGDESAVLDGEAAMAEDGTTASKQGESHNAHESCRASQQQQQHTPLTTKLYWILGMLDSDAISLACPDSKEPGHERANVLDVLQQLCSEC
jgi:hypothetical protein